MNILFIPHVPNLNVINRVYEFAKNTDSYFLNWQIDNSSLKQKIFSQLNSLRCKQDDKIVQIALLFKPEKLATRFNTFNLNRLIDKLQIDMVVNANALLFDIKNVKVPVVYDLVDDHLEVNSDIGLNKKRVQKIKKDIENSMGVICVTEILEKKVKDLGLHQNTITIENGVYIEKFLKAKSLKQELGLENKKVFGFVGGIDEWTGIEKVIEQYLKIKNDTNAFLVVGGNDGDFYKNLVKKYNNDILFIGRVKPELVADYFKTIDVGLIPFELNDFTHNALPIKALEYALAGASVISTPLNGLKAKKFPFVEFCEIERFAECMKKETKEFDFDFTQISWEKQSARLIGFLNRIKRDKQDKLDDVMKIGMDSIHLYLDEEK